MDPTYAQEYERFEKNHWWHVARGELIRWAIDRYAVGSRWLDIGCGTGVLLESYDRIPDKMGIEMDGPAAERAGQKGLKTIHVTDRTDCNYARHGAFDLITLCDVIEHIEHDESAIAGVYDALNKGGIALVTAPALRSLWSAHDVRNHHFRRYRRGELMRLFPKNKWRILKVTYFSTFLLPLIWSYRIAKKSMSGTDPARTASDKKFGPRWVDAALLTIFRAECRLVRRMPLPMGSSLLLVARKI